MQTNGVHEILIKDLVSKDGEQQTAIGKKEVIKESKSNAEVTNQQTSIGKGVKRTIGTAATVYGASQLVVQPIMRNKINMASVSGDYVQADNLAKTNALVNQSVGIGMEIAGIGAAFAVNIGLGGVALLGSFTKHTTQAVSRHQTNNMIAAENNINNYLQGYEQNRFIDMKKGG